VIGKGPGWPDSVLSTILLLFMDGHEVSRRPDEGRSRPPWLARPRRACVMPSGTVLATDGRRRPRAVAVGLEPRTGHPVTRFRVLRTVVRERASCPPRAQPACQRRSPNPGGRGRMRQKLRQQPLRRPRPGSCPDITSDYEVIQTRRPWSVDNSLTTTFKICRPASQVPMSEVRTLLSATAGSSDIDSVTMRCAGFTHLVRILPRCRRRLGRARRRCSGHHSRGAYVFPAAGDGACLGGDGLPLDNDGPARSARRLSSAAASTPLEEPSARRGPRAVQWP
jgi:hypothetical protein